MTVSFSHRKPSSDSDGNYSSRIEGPYEFLVSVHLLGHRVDVPCSPGLFPAAIYLCLEDPQLISFSSLQQLSDTGPEKDFVFVCLFVLPSLPSFTKNRGSRDRPTSKSSQWFKLSISRLQYLVLNILMHYNKSKIIVERQKQWIYNFCF